MTPETTTTTFTADDLAALRALVAMQPRPQPWADFVRDNHADHQNGYLPRCATKCPI